MRVVSTAALHVSTPANDRKGAERQRESYIARNIDTS